MKKSVNLVSGNISSTLIKLSLPILGTSFIQMAYNMIDMLWVGRIGSSAVAAVGTAGYSKLHVFYAQFQFFFYRKPINTIKYFFNVPIYLTFRNAIFFA